MSSYATLFTDLLMAALQTATGQVQAAEPLVPEAERQDAWHWLSYALQQPALWPQTRALLLALAPKMEQAGHRQDWLGYLQTAYALAQQQADQAAQAELAYQIGLLYRLLTHYDEAMRWLQTGLTSFQQLGERQGEARVLNEMAWVEQLQRHLHKATHHVDCALSLLAENDSERGMSYRVQGMIAIYYNKWEQAEAFHRAALAIFEKYGLLRKVGWSLVNIGFALRGQQKYELAIETLQRASSVLLEIGDDHSWSIAQLNLGLTFAHIKATDNAIACYLNTERVAYRSNDQLQLAGANLNLGLAYIAKGEYKSASHAFQKALVVYKALDIKSMIINTMDGLAVSYTAQHRFLEARLILEDAMQLLAQIVDAPNYDYYYQSLNKHLQEANHQQVMQLTLRPDVE